MQQWPFIFQFWTILTFCSKRL